MKYLDCWVGAIALLLGIVVVAGMVLALEILWTTETVRAHQQVNEMTNWGQGRAPPTDWCPSGTIRFETDEHLFLECYRGSEGP